MNLVLATLLILFQSVVPRSFLLTPDAPEMNRRAPDAFKARFETTKGNIVIEIRREWSPKGVDRFYNLARAGYYDQSKFFRAVKDRWTQFGIDRDPQVSTLWKSRPLPDEPRMISNVKGTLAYAFAVPNGRTTQIFFNNRDNSATHDVEPFVPFGRVVEGMDVMDSLNFEYGEAIGGIRAGKQGPLFEEGNKYLDREFPRLDMIIRTVIIEN